MSQPGSDFFANLPGFDFLKSLSGAQSTAIHPWLKPTLDPKELDQRIQELKTVLFWLEQNTKALNASIQALEVQRMTLSTLQQMNVDWKSALQPKKASRASSDAPGDAAAQPSATTSTAPAAPEAMRLWTNLANQFGQIAQQSMTDMQRHAREAVTAVGDKVAKAAPTSATGSASSAKPRSKKPAGSAKTSRSRKA